jgi:hypothetical protein
MILLGLLLENIGADAACRLRWCSWPGRAIRMAGLAVTRSRSKANANIFESSATTRFATIGAPPSAISSTSVRTS